jgi:hypothetical protein
MFVAERIETNRQYKIQICGFPNLPRSGAGDTPSATASGYSTTSSNLSLEEL